MNKSEIIAKAGKILKRSGDFLYENSPTVFAGVAIAGIIGTVAMTVKATNKARDTIEEATYKDPDTGEEIQPDTKETVILIWKYYVPVVLMTGMTIGSLVISHRIQNKRNVLLAGLYSTSQKALEEYQAKTEEIVGKNKSEKIHEEIASDYLTNNPVNQGSIVATGKGGSLCFDVLSGQYFWSDYDKVRKAVNDFNERLISEDRLSLNEFYSLLGINTNELGDEVGWVAGKGIDVSYKSRLASDGTPCLVLDYNNPPTWSFRTDW